MGTGIGSGRSRRRSTCPHTSAVALRLANDVWKTEKEKSSFLMVWSEPWGNHSTVTSVPLSSALEVLEENAFCQLFRAGSFESCAASLGEREAPPCCLNHSQFKGTDRSAPCSSYFPHRGSLKETAAAFVPLFLPRGFELTFPICSCAFAGDNCCSQNTVWKLVRFSKTWSRNYGPLSSSHRFLFLFYFTVF